MREACGLYGIKEAVRLGRQHKRKAAEEEDQHCILLHLQQRCLQKPAYVSIRQHTLRQHT